jgi:hypothetical protein
MKCVAAARDRCTPEGVTIQCRESRGGCPFFVSRHCWACGNNLAVEVDMDVK